MATGCSGGQPSAAANPSPAPGRAFELELVVRTPAALRNVDEVQRLVDAAAVNGFGTVSLLVKQDEDGAIESGRSYYPSAVAPAAPGYADFDVLQAVLTRAHARGLRVKAWVPQFHDQASVRAHPGWAMQALVAGRVVPYNGSRQNETFANPLDEEVQRYQLSVLREVASRYAVDGVMLDWIRFDDYPMDLGDATRARFKALSGVDPIEIDFKTESPLRARWNDFRTAEIARYIAQVRAALPSQLALGVYILPPDFVEVGQDAARFAADVQQLAPMCYHSDWRFPLDWVWNRCLSSTVAKAGATAVAPTLGANLPDDEVRQIVAQIRQSYPGIRTLVWFQHEAWTEANLARLARLSNGN